MFLMHFIISEMFLLLHCIYLLHIVDNTFESTIEKENFELAEKKHVNIENDVNTLPDNFCKEYAKPSKTYGLDTFLEEMNNLKLSEDTTCKKLTVEDVTKGKLRNEEGEDSCDSVTEAKLIAQGLKKKEETSESTYVFYNFNSV